MLKIIASLFFLLIQFSAIDGSAFMQGSALPFNGSLALSEIATDRIFQRIGTAKTITFSGTYTGSPNSVDVQIIDAGSSTVLVPWTTLDPAPSGGNFAGTISVPQYDGWMKWQTRIHSQYPPTTYTSANQFGVGILVLMTGQSEIPAKWALSSGSPPYSYCQCEALCG